ncbi:very long chain fatty acid elongase AAEL008004 [Halyomorpha halys]|uniref:very long chain fatty acid elongase AAEL008004 n=1 Tax=Halyomorpha halys TaxID=286706 RepID=UPI0006D517C7
MSCLNVTYSVPEEVSNERIIMAGLVKMALDEYTSIIDRISDPRVEDWPLMDSPFPTLFMVGAYLYFVVFLGPKMMENRKPFKLNSILVVYNAAQTLFSLIMFSEHLMSGWLLDYSYKCQPVDYSRNPTAMRMANLCWWYYISKLTEFMDTIFFVLRKKDNQITLLHLYHHSLTPIETWVCVKFLAGGHGTFSNLVNNLVHIIMYTYYMLSAMGPQYQKFLWWKQHLTTLQLAQFTIVFIHSAQVLFFDCGYPKLIAAFLLVHSTIFFALFFDFYQKAYNKEQARKNLQKLQ